MSSIRRIPEMDQQKIKELVEQHGAREAFQAVARKILEGQRPMHRVVPSPVPAVIPKIKLPKRELHEDRTNRFSWATIPSEEEARCWLKQWREGAFGTHATNVTTRSSEFPRNRKRMEE
jgi:hypothetical protein